MIALLALLFCLFSFFWLWQGAAADQVLIKRAGVVFAKLDLSTNRQIAVPGALGISLIEIENKRVRVLSDPGPRQYCVRQGWLSRAGEIAICAPNQISLQVIGEQENYDTLSY